MLARSLAQAAGSKASLLSWQPAAASQAALLDGSSQRAIEGALRSSSRAFSPAASVAVAARVLVSFIMAPSCLRLTVHGTIHGVTHTEPPEGTQALLFDCDGTLVDTMGVYRIGWRQVFGRHGFEMTEEWFATWGGHSTQAFVEAAFPDAEPEFIAQVSREGHETFLESVHLVEPFEHVVEVARANHGRLPLAVVSGGPRVAVLASCERSGSRTCSTWSSRPTSTGAARSRPSGPRPSQHPGPAGSRSTS